MAAARPHLRPVEATDEPIVVTLPNAQNLVVFPDEPAYAVAWAWETEHYALKDAEKDLTIKRRQITKLQNERDVRRRAAGKIDVIEALFEIWQKATGHTGAKLTPERIDDARNRLVEKYTSAHLAMALIGLARHAYRGNDDWHVAMRSGSQVERYANKCPADARRQMEERFSTKPYPKDERPAPPSSLFGGLQ